MTALVATAARWLLPAACVAAIAAAGHFSRYTWWSFTVGILSTPAPPPTPPRRGPRNGPLDTTIGRPARNSPPLNRGRRVRKCRRWPLGVGAVPLY